MDPSIWNRLFVVVYLDLYILTHLFGPVYFDYSILTILFGTVYLDPSNLALALGHRVQPLAFAHVRLSDDIVANLG